MKESEKAPFLKWLSSIQSFSKWITLVWIVLWTETILFSQVATILQFGDVSAISIINDNVLQIGLVICSFYFSTKCIENVAKGIEAYLMMKYESININKNENSEENDDILASG